MAETEMHDALKARVVPLARRHPARPFLVEMEEGRRGRPIIRLHASKAVASAADRRDLAERLRTTLGNASIGIEAHRANVFFGQRSIEGFARIAKGEILFDPTCAVTRARGLAAYASAMRRAFGRRIDGIFWAGEWRTIYVVFDADRVFVDGKVKVDFLRQAETEARARLFEACGPEATDFVAAVRIGFEAPEFPVVPIDDKTARTSASLLARIKRKAAASAMGAAFGLGTIGAAPAADLFDSPTHFPPPESTLPAVSGLNGKIAIMGGVVDLVDGEGDTPTADTGAHGVVIGEGSLSLPLGHSFGLQLDGAVGVNDVSRWTWAVGGHAFWRDPSKGLVGVIASYTSWEQGLTCCPPPDEATFNMTRVGGEAELYAGQFTAAARAGAQWVQTPGPGGFSPLQITTGFFGDVDLMWYATPDFVLKVGGEYVEGPGAAFTAGLEYQPTHLGLSGLTLFADGKVGSEHYAALGGLRYYFGAGPKSLIDRHRQDDPDNFARQGLDGHINYYYVD